MTHPTTTPQTDLIAAQEFCQKLWPGADVLIDEGPGVRDVWVMLRGAKLRIKLTVARSGAGWAFVRREVWAKAFEEGELIAESIVDSPHWKEAILSVAMQLDALADQMARQIKPDIAGALEG